MKILNPSDWPKPKGYSNGTQAKGETIFIAGQIGWDSQQNFADGLVKQIEQSLKNIVEVLAVGDAKPENITRMNWYLTDKAEYLSKQREIGEIYRAIIGKHYPAMTLVIVKDLLEGKALVEIEVTAVV